MIFHDVEQNTEEWLSLRCGTVTSSGLSKVMANFGRGFSETAKKYASQIAIEQITGNPISSGYSNAHMDRGHEQESIARSIYEGEYFCTVENGGFFQTDNLGGSPDGLLSNNGLIEIKSAIATVHFERIKKQSYDSAYKWQLAGNLKVSGRDYIDFISYCEDFPQGKKLYVYRCLASNFAEEFEMIDERLSKFYKMVDDAKDKILNSNYSILEAA